MSFWIDRNRGGVPLSVSKADEPLELFYGFYFPSEQLMVNKIKTLPFSYEE